MDNVLSETGASTASQGSSSQEMASSQVVRTDYQRIGTNAQSRALL